MGISSALWRFNSVLEKRWNSTFDLGKIYEIDNGTDLAEAIRAIYDKNNEFSAGFIAEKQMEIKDVARSIGYYSEVSSLIDHYAKNLDVPTTDSELLNKMTGMCCLNQYGRIANIIDNYTVIMENDPFYASVQMNEMSLQLCIGEKVFSHL